MQQTSPPTCSQGCGSLAAPKAMAMVMVMAKVVCMDTCLGSFQQSARAAAANTIFHVVRRRLWMGPRATQAPARPQTPQPHLLNTPCQLLWACTTNSSSMVITWFHPQHLLVQMATAARAMACCTACE